MNQKNLKLIFKFFMFGITTLLAGCQSVVYKDSATTFVSASHSLIKKISATDASLAKSIDSSKQEIIIADQNCPISNERLFVKRRGVNFAEFANGINKCQLLINCESNPDLVSCGKGCYSNKETDCINQIDHDYKVMALTKSPESLEAKNQMEVADLIMKVEYGKYKVTGNQMIVTSLRVFSSYLDLLEQLSNKQTSEFESKSKSLATNMDAVVKQYQSLTKEQLSTETKEAFATSSKYISGLGKLLSDITIMTKNLEDATKIKALVKSNSKDVKELLGLTMEVVEADETLGNIFADLRIETIRKDMEVKYSKTSDPYDRYLIFRELESSYSNKNLDKSNIKALFATVEESHDLLVSLVQNPTEKQKRELLNASFQQFKILADDAAFLLN